MAQRELHHLQRPAASWPACCSTGTASTSKAIAGPSIPAGHEILRIAPDATHTPDKVRSLATILDGLWQELGLPVHLA